MCIYVVGYSEPDALSFVKIHQDSAKLELFKKKYRFMLQKKGYSRIRILEGLTVLVFK